MSGNPTDGDHRLQRVGDWGMVSPWRFILVWGVVCFGGLFGLAMLVWILPDIISDLRSAVIIVPVVVFGAAVVGAAWGTVMWLFIRWRTRRAARQLVEREGR